MAKPKVYSIAELNAIVKNSESLEKILEDLKRFEKLRRGGLMDLQVECEEWYFEFVKYTEEQGFPDSYERHIYQEWLFDKIFNKYLEPAGVK